MAKKITFGLSVREVDEAIRQLKEYRESLNRKCQTLVDRLIQEGITVSNATLGSVTQSDLAGKGQISVESGSSGEVVSATLVLSGEKVLFIEFGAGAYYLPPDHPQAGEFGYGSGTYPDQTHVPKPGFWFYYDDAGQKKFSRGNPAYMPMYQSAQAMRLQLTSLAKEIFGG